MRSGADVEMHPRELNNKQITRLHQLLHEAKFKDPDGSHLSPAGHLPVLPIACCPWFSLECYTITVYVVPWTLRGLTTTLMSVLSPLMAGFSCLALQTVEGCVA